MLAMSDVGSTGVLNLAAPAAGGNAGLLVVNAAQQLEIAGSLLGSGVKTGSVEVDVGTLASFEDLNNRLNAGSFTESRDLRVRSGNVSIDGVVNAKSFILALDAGSITVNGTINAAGSTGGRINLISNGNITLNNGSVLSVRGTDFDSAGKGGSIWLKTTGAGQRTSLAAPRSISASMHKLPLSASRGQFGGKLHLRAPQNASFNDLLIDPLAGSVLGASSIEIEGFRSYLFNQSNVLLRAGTLAIAGEHLTTTTIHSNNTSFMANHAAITTRLLGGNPALQSISVLQPGVEIVNRGGSISLGTATSAAVNDWNLASFRYGPQNAAGTLTMRAAGNLEFYNALSDGFTPVTTGTTPLVERLWLAPLSALNTQCPSPRKTGTYASLPAQM
ncbi:MAG: hypothetical protein IPK32_08965 [Verrucomicrobiaceae bacterium]|nr:hypothetical protein [Verrucomicrobiaceae bacterium]